MKNNNLTKAYPVRLTFNQDKAIKVLELYGYNRSKFIRSAIEDKLKLEYRKLIYDCVNKSDCPF